MTVWVATGLCLQILALVIMHAAINGHWIRHLGALLLLVASLYQGGTEVMQWLAPGSNPYRAMLTQEQIDSWVILVSLAMLAYTIAYVIGTRRSKGVEAEPSVKAVDGLHLWWLLPLTLPLIAATIQGKANRPSAGLGASLPASNNYVLSGTTLQFLVYLVAVCGVVVFVRLGPKVALPTLLCQALVLSFAGARSSVVLASILSLYGASIAGIRIPKKQLMVAGAVMALLMASISASRAVDGRQSFAADAGFAQRLNALTDGLEIVPTDEGRQAIMKDFIYRFDGNTFGAMVLGSLDHGANPVGLTTASNDIFLAIPSFLNPNKRDSSLATRDEEVYLGIRFGLPSSVDFLPGLFGTLIAYFGRAGLFLLSGLLGVAFAAADVVIFKTCTSARLLFGIGVLNCVLLYEVGPSVYPLTLRGVLVLIFLLMTTRWIHAQVTRVRFRKTSELTALQKSAPMRHNDTRMIDGSSNLTERFGFRS